MFDSNREYVNVTLASDDYRQGYAHKPIYPYRVCLWGKSLDEEVVGLSLALWHESVTSRSGGTPG